VKTGIRVKRWGKSPPVVVVTSLAVCLMDCKAKYITGFSEHRAIRPGSCCFSRQEVVRGRLLEAVGDSSPR